MKYFSDTWTRIKCGTLHIFIVFNFCQIKKGRKIDTFRKIDWASLCKVVLSKILRNLRPYFLWFLCNGFGIFVHQPLWVSLKNVIKFEYLTQTVMQKALNICYVSIINKSQTIIKKLNNKKYGAYKFFACMHLFSAQETYLN